MWLSASVYAHTQQHLLRTQVSQAAAVLGEIVPAIETPLQTSAAIVDVDHGSTAPVRSYVGHDVGTAKGTLFRSLSIWRLSPGGPVELAQMGIAPKLKAIPGRLASFLDGIRAPGVLAVDDLLSGRSPRIGFAVESVGSSPRYAVYAELEAPASRRTSVPASSAFDQLNFALYLGAHPTRANLIESTVPNLPLSGAASARIPFGDTSLDFVATPSGPLGGGLLPALPWIVGALGLALTGAGVGMTEWLVRGRHLAEALAVENHRLYAEQRSIAQTLQRALLPADLPPIRGLDLASRYLPGDPSADIGGDWYDVIRCDDHSAIFAVGDVSGRGIPAANTMASLHYAIRAYAAQGDDAPTILCKLTELLDIGRDGHFATVLLGHVDVPGHTLTLASAGHPPLLVVSPVGAEFVAPPPGVPIGVLPGSPYTTVTVTVPPRSTLLAYTDGLVERRGEHLDTGLERLRSAAVQHVDVPGATALLDTVSQLLATQAHADDVALLALHWTD